MTLHLLRSSLRRQWGSVRWQRLGESSGGSVAGALGAVYVPRRFAKRKKYFKTDQAIKLREERSQDIYGGLIDILYVDDENFDTELLGNTKPVVLNCYADWCDKCPVMVRTLKRATVAAEGKVVLARMNVDHAPRTTRRLKLDRVPTTIVFKLGTEMWRMLGVVEEDVILHSMKYAENLAA